MNQDILGLSVLGGAIAAGLTALGVGRWRKSRPRRPDYISPAWRYHSFHNGHQVNETEVERMLDLFLLDATSRGWFTEPQVRAWVSGLRMRRASAMADALGDESWKQWS